MSEHVDRQRRWDNNGERVQLDTAGVAARLGVEPGTIRRYRVADRERYHFPEPDGTLGRTPWWWSTTIDAWVAARPGKGAGAGRPSKATLETRAAAEAAAAKPKRRRRK